VTAAAEFAAFFRRATGHEPYDYQLRLGLADGTPDLVEVPTGAGKTQAVLVAWLFARRVRGVGPRRLVYALPMRTLVEQTVEVARTMRESLGLSDEELPVHVLMGGEPPASFQGWREHPESEQILVGTIDMLLSRALNRGYGESRFQWPVSFGFLNSDCWWVLDEVQLMGPARSTSAQLQGLRAKLGSACACESTWMSATIDRDALVTVDRPQLGPALTLSEQDRSTDQLSRRLNAIKRLDRVDVSGHPPARLPRAIAGAVLGRHMAGTRSIVVLNRVDLAQGVLRALRKELKGLGPHTVLLHSRFRPPERAACMAAALAPVAPDGPGRIVVSTQVIEAGVDTSAALLATETAPFSALVQRWGRCNRAGELAEGVALWLDRGELDPRAAAPYEAPDLSASRSALLSLVGTSVSPAMLAEISVPEARPQCAVLRRRDLVDLFDTSPDMSGTDVDVSRFIRDEDERTVSVFFRDLERQAPDRGPKGQPYAQRDELVEVPIAAARDTTRAAWVFDYVDDVWRSAGLADRYPGATLMLRAADGGYDKHLGWTGVTSDRPAPISLEAAGTPESIGDERQSFSRDWRTLADHLADVEGTAIELLRALGSLELASDDTEAVTAAAALHDIGKAHPAFQAMLLSQVDDDERVRRAGIFWAKSPLAGGRHVRPHFRHELASALALLPADGSLDAIGRPSELAVYLIASHHGRVRMSIRPAPDERPPPDSPDAGRFALGIADGDQLAEISTPRGVIPATRLDLGCMELGGGGGRSWTELACELRDRCGLGPFRLAYLEALLRIADWRASG
jgi:CRISPR-associated endonuclease/helicase Cas3